MENADSAILTLLADRLRPVGMILRGGFHPGASDDVPPLSNGSRPATLILVGNAGPAMWHAFAATRKTGQNPLDDWTRRLLDEIASAVGATALFPFDGPPWLPFQRWAQRADNVHPSPTGPLIHPTFGLWHAYRGVLALAETIEIPAIQSQPSPCETCPDKPCLSACPVDALAPGTYDVPACVAHLGSAAGIDCLSGSCQARAACPVGSDYRYVPDQNRFHMHAFLRRVSAVAPPGVKDGRHSG